MSGIIEKITVLAACLVAGGCNTLSLPGNSLSVDEVLLDQVNASAKNNPDWFSSGMQEQDKLTQKYHGKLKPELAIYLENDIYVYQDNNLSAYILEIVDRLLQGWEGVKPNIAVVVETGKFFTAYVDELHQLHVSTGLLRKIDNEDQLASVIAHELSHVLLRHNREKSITERTESALDIGGMFMASGGEVLGSLSGSKDYREKGQEGLLGFQSLGFVWADILTPSWSQDNEKEADLMGLDLLIRANYNYEEFPTVIEKIADAETERSERLEQFSRLASALIEKNRKKLKTSFGRKWDKCIEHIGETLENLFVEQVTSAVASRNKSHQERAERIDALKTYLQGAHGGGDLPPESATENFAKIVGGEACRAGLHQDLAAIEVIDALKDKDTSLATSKFPGVRYNPRGVSPMSCCIAKSLFDISNGKYDPAVAALDGLILNNMSPAEAYLQLAELYRLKSKYDQAEASLKLGINTIGRDYKFLPMLIRVNKSSGNISAAEEYTLRCKQYDDDAMHSLNDFGFGEKNRESYYQKCVAVMGYDVVEKRQKEASIPMPSGFGKILQRVSPFPPQ